MRLQSMSPTLLLLLSLLSPALLAAAQTSYANEFPDPDYILAGDFPENTVLAQATIGKWARSLAQDGPWSVTTKAATAPSGDIHDFMSWAPYWWPDCSEVGNTTALPEAEVWTQCPYVRRDGQFNPDVRGVNDIGNFQTMSDAVFYNALIWGIDRDEVAAGRKAAEFIAAWFLDEETRMNPHLNYAQMIRGLDGRPGSATGVLDLKGMTKVANAILIMRKAEAPFWTAEMDAQMVAWTHEYIGWLESAELALDEGSAENNHGTFYYNQLAACKLTVNDTPGALNVTQTYFARQFMDQIAAGGDQPLESARTRPFHYRAYNLAAMITNARIEKYANPDSDVWERTTSSGASIKDALDYAMAISAADSGEDSYDEELHPNAAAVAAVYGDASGAYLAYLRPKQPPFHEDPHFLWNAGAWSAEVEIPASAKGAGKDGDKKATGVVAAADLDGGAAGALGRVSAALLAAAVGGAVVLGSSFL